MRISPVALFFSVYLLISRFSHTIRISTAPISRAFNVSSTPKTYFPVSWLISSKYFPIKRFSCINFTFDRISADSSIAWLKPFSPPYETSTTFNILACNRGSNISDWLSSVLKSAEPASISPETLG
ncbi:hypothetical protein OIU78_015166 [Salix suchowensis]|nr:hypothetical protein OIU78_015166 [Salix suchowensis]